MSTGHQRHQKYKNKHLNNRIAELENNFKPINIYINDTDEFEKKKELTKKRTSTNDMDKF